VLLTWHRYGVDAKVKLRPDDGATMVQTIDDKSVGIVVGSRLCEGDVDDSSSVCVFDF